MSSRIQEFCADRAGDEQDGADAGEDDATAEGERILPAAEAEHASTMNAVNPTIGAMA